MNRDKREAVLLKAAADHMSGKGFKNDEISGMKYFSKMLEIQFAVGFTNGGGVRNGSVLRYRVQREKEETSWDEIIEK